MLRGVSSPPSFARPFDRVNLTDLFGFHERTIETFWPEYGTNQTLMVLNPALNLTTDSFRSGQIQQINNNNDAFSR